MISKEIHVQFHTGVNILKIIISLVNIDVYWQGKSIIFNLLFN